MNNPKSHPRIVYREEGDEALLFDPDSGNVKVLNQTGKFIWSKLDGNRSKQAIIEDIVATFEIADVNKLKNDLERFLNDLDILKFLEHSRDEAV